MPVIEKYRDKILIQITHLDDRERLHNPLGAANKMWDKTGKILLREEYYIDGRFHRDELDGAAAIEFYDSGKIKRIAYSKHGSYHRENSDANAAITTFHENGNIMTLRHFYNDKLHRSCKVGPADCSFYENGLKRVEYYLENDEFHNLYGPAEIMYDKSGKIQNEFYYLNGGIFDKASWEAQVKKILASTTASVAPASSSVCGGICAACGQFDDYAAPVAKFNNEIRCFRHCV